MVYVFFSLNSATHCTSLRSGGNIDIVSIVCGQMWGMWFIASLNATKHPLSTHLEAVASSCFGDELAMALRGPRICSLATDNSRSGGAAAWVSSSAGLCLDSWWALRETEGDTSALQRRPAWKQE